MKKDIPYLIGAVAYLILAFLICKWVYRISRSMDTPPRLVVRSFVYALFFGLGSIRNSGPFHMPAPVLLAAIYSRPQFIMMDCIIPFIFCWALILVFLLVDAYFKKREEAKKVNIYDE